MFTLYHSQTLQPSPFHTNKKYAVNKLNQRVSSVAKDQLLRVGTREELVIPGESLASGQDEHSEEESLGGFIGIDPSGSFTKILFIVDELMV